MNFDELLQPQRLVMQQDGDTFRFIDAENPQFKILVQFPTTKFVQPDGGYFKFVFTQPSFHKHYAQFQENIKRFAWDEFELKYDYELEPTFRFDPDTCSYFHHAGPDNQWTPEDRYVIPMVAIHGLDDTLRLDMQVVQLKFYESVPILPDLSVSLFN